MISLNFRLISSISYLQVPLHDILNSGLRELQEVNIVEDSQSPGLNEGDDHVDEFLGGAVPPVVSLQ